MEEVPRIAGAEQLVAVFGYWPSFHDAEVLWMRLDRRAHGEGCYGPTLEALIHAFDFEATSPVGSDGRHALRRSVLVHLRFRDVDGLRVEGFNFQNKLHGLTLEDLRDRQME